MNLGFLSQWRWISLFLIVTCLVHLLVRSLYHPHYLHLLHQLAYDVESNHFERMNWNAKGRMNFPQILCNIFLLLYQCFFWHQFSLKLISEDPQYNWVKYKINLNSSHLNEIFKFTFDFCLLHFLKSHTLFSSLKHA